MLTSVNTSNACSIVHGWAAAQSARYRRCIDRSAFAMSRQYLIGNARYRDRARQRSNTYLERCLEDCEASLLEERLGLRRQQILQINGRHAVGRGGENRYRVDDGRVR